jgi:hypothetical protein
VTARTPGPTMVGLAGIPGTISSEAKAIRWHRMPDAPAGRVYAADVADGVLTAVVSQDAAGESGRLLWHVSVSHRDREGRKDRVPTWDELKHAAYRLVQADVPLVLIFPRRSTPAENYVNVHDTCLHLWEAETDVDR